MRSIQCNAPKHTFILLLGEKKMFIPFMNITIFKHDILLYCHFIKTIKLMTKNTPTVIITCFTKD